MRFGAEARLKQKLPESFASGIDDGRGGRGCVDLSVPVAKEVGGLMKALIAGGGVVDGVSQTLRDIVVGVGVDVGLERQHIRCGEVIAIQEQLPDALVAVGCGPVEGDAVGVVVGRDAELAVARIPLGGSKDLRELNEGNVSGPFKVAGNGVDGDWA